MIDGQMEITDFIKAPKQKPKKEIKPGAWLNEEDVGHELRFNDLQRHIGGLVAYEATTVSKRWFKAIRVDRIKKTTMGDRVMIFCDGSRMRGTVSEIRFDQRERYPVRVFEIKGGS